MRFSLTLWLCGGAFAFGCWLPSVAAARGRVDELITLDYQVEPGLSGCPDVEAFKELVSRRLGLDFPQPAVKREVEIRVGKEGQGLTGSILWRESGETTRAPRRLSTPNEDCPRLVATMAFVVAVQMEVMASEAPESQPVVPDDPEPAAAAEPSSMPTDASEVSPVPPIFAVGVGIGVGLGLAPDAIAQGRAFGSVGLRSVSLELGVEGRPPVSTEVGDGKGFRHYMLLGTVAGCWNVHEFSACGFTKVGALGITGEGVDQSASPVGLVVQVGPRLGYLFRFGDQLGVLAHADGAYLLSPWTVRLDGATVWRVPRSSAVAGIDFVARFQ